MGSGYGSVEFVGEEEGEGEKFRGFVGGIVEYDILVISIEFFESFFVVEILSDIGRLLFNGDKEVEGFVVEIFFGVIVVNVFDGVMDDFLVVQFGFGGDFVKDYDYIGFGGSFVSNFGKGVFSKVGIKDSIGDLISNFIGVIFVDRFGLYKVNFGQ